MDGIKNVNSGVSYTDQNVLKQKSVKNQAGRNTVFAGKNKNSSQDIKVVRANKNMAMDEMKIALEKEGLGNYLDLIV